MTQLSKLDLWHKGVVPAVIIVLMVLGLVYQYRNNTDKQRQLDDKQKQIDRLQAEFQATQIQRQTAEAQQQAAQAQQHAAEQREREQMRRAEEYAHRARVEVCKAGLRSAQTVSKTPGADGFMAMVEKLEGRNCLREAVGRLRKIDVGQFGEDKAEVLWGPAREQAEKELKAE